MCNGLPWNVLPISFNVRKVLVLKCSLLTSDEIFFFRYLVSTSLICMMVLVLKINDDYYWFSKTSGVPFHLLSSAWLRPAQEYSSSSCQKPLEKNYQRLLNRQRCLECRNNLILFLISFYLLHINAQFTLFQLVHYSNTSWCLLLEFIFCCQTRIVKKNICFHQYDKNSQCTLFL